MAIDTTPSTVATNALQAIPFAALIGGPLDACIKAQAAAAKTSWEFINQVGLTIDPVTGEKKAINVTFQYNNNGKMTTLIVPLLVIVPIPYLAIDKVSIDFLANISAGSSSTSETSSDTELGVDVTAEASLKVGPFSLNVTANANYSSKQHSKASQDSSYSVEYTMGVQVEGGQADMPAGLTTILNILQGSISSVNDDDSVNITPAALSFNKKQSATLQVVVKDTQGVFAPGAKVTCTLPATNNPFQPVILLKGHTIASIQKEITDGLPLNKVSRAFLHRYPNENKHQISAFSGQNALSNLNDAPVVSGMTDKNGSVTFYFLLKDSVYQGTEMMQANIIVNADVPKVGTNPPQFNNEAQTIVASIIPQGPVDSLSASQQELDFTAVSQPQTLTIKITDTDQAPVSGTLVTVDISCAPTAAGSIFDKIKAGGVEQASAITASGTTDTNGSVIFTFTTLATAAAGKSTGTIAINASGTTAVNIPINVNIPKKLNADRADNTEESEA